jgi:hypothetical protein
MNYSDELSFRDFKKAESFKNDHENKIMYRNKENAGFFFGKGISYCSFNTMQEILLCGTKEDLNSLVCLADELDSLIF